MTRLALMMGSVALSVVFAAACSSSLQSARSTPTSSSPSSMDLRHGEMVPPCRAAALSVHGGQHLAGFHGEARGEAVITNSGSTPCRLGGVPGVQVLSSIGDALPVEPVPASDDPGTALIVPPGGSAVQGTLWGNWCGAAPGPLRIRVTLPGGVVLTGPFDGPPGFHFAPACADASLSSTFGVVGAFHAPR